MPSRKTRFRRSRKGSRRRRTTRGRLVRSSKVMGKRAAMIPTGMPHQQFIKFKYSEVLYSNGISMSGQTAYVQYRSNSLYDPQYATNFSTASGHSNNGQPLYRDQWANFYYQYRVYATKYRVTFTPTSVDAADLGSITMPQPMTMVLYASDTPTTDTDIVISKQRIGAKFVDSGGVAYSVNKLNLSYYQVHNRSLGLTKRQYSDDKTTAGGMSVGANPTTVTYMNVLLQCWDQTPLLYGYLTVQTKYYCKLFDQIENIAAS